MLRTCSSRCCRTMRHRRRCSRSARPTAWRPRTACRSQCCRATGTRRPAFACTMSPCSLPWCWCGSASGEPAHEPDSCRGCGHAACATSAVCSSVPACPVSQNMRAVLPMAPCTLHPTPRVFVSPACQHKALRTPWLHATACQAQVQRAGLDMSSCLSHTHIPCCLGHTHICLPGAHHLAQKELVQTQRICCCRVAVPRVTPDGASTPVPCSVPRSAH